MTGSSPTALEEAVSICEAAGDEDITVRLAGGLAIQYLTPEFPPRGGHSLTCSSYVEGVGRCTCEATPQAPGGDR